jgi:hypothetical protein
MSKSKSSQGKIENAEWQRKLTSGKRSPLKTLINLRNLYDVPIQGFSKVPLSLIFSGLLDCG